MKKTIVMGLFLAVTTLLGASTMLVGVEKVVASTDPKERPGNNDPSVSSAKRLAPGIERGFDPQPEPPGVDSSAHDDAPGIEARDSELDANALAPGRQVRESK